MEIGLARRIQVPLLALFFARASASRLPASWNRTRPRPRPRKHRLQIIAVAYAVSAYAIGVALGGHAKPAKRVVEHAREGDFDRYLTAGEAIEAAAQIALSADAEIDVALLERLAAAVAERRRMNEMWFNGLLAATLADGYRRRGDLVQARILIDETFGDAGIVYSAEVWRTKGELEMAVAASTKTSSQRTAAREQATRCFETALAVSRQHGTRLFELRAATALAHHAKGEGGTRQALAQMVSEYPTGATSSDWQAATAVLAGTTTQ